MKIEEKLAEMEFVLPPSPKRGGVYMPAKRVGNLVYISGQTPTVNGIHQYVGAVGREITLEEGRKAAECCALNMLAVLKDTLGSLDKVKQFVQIVGYVRSDDNFGEQPKVIDAASELFFNAYGEAGVATRIAIGTNETPGGVPVEILGIVEVED